MTKTYRAKYIPGTAIEIDGILNEPVWDQTELVRDFAFPWEDRATPPTEFRALFDDSLFYFAFTAVDEDIVLVEDYRAKEDVIREDRVELFFALDEDLNDYFCLEIDPLGRVLDYQAAYHRRFDRSWSLAGLQTGGRLTDEGYCVEGLIPLNSLESLGLPAPDSGQPIKFGIYRAEFSHTEGADWSESWISWVDPQTPAPDFHVPGSFGQLVLQKGRE